MSLAEDYNSLFQRFYPVPELLNFALDFVLGGTHYLVLVARSVSLVSVGGLVEVWS